MSIFYPLSVISQVKSVRNAVRRFGKVCSGSGHKKCGLMPVRRFRFNKVKRKEGIEADPQMPAYITSYERFWSYDGMA